jgi:hypothetical protein
MELTNLVIDFNRNIGCDIDSRSVISLHRVAQ